MRAALLAILLVSCGEDVSFSGTGTLRAVAVGEGRGIRSSVATRDEKYITFLTTGPGPRLVATDRALATLSITLTPHRASPSLDMGAGLLALRSVKTLTVYSLPDLSRGEDLEVKYDVFGDVHPESFTLCPTRRGWVAVSGDGSVVLVDVGPLHAKRIGRTETKVVYRAATDDETGNLVVMGARHVEIFDLERAESVARCAVECRRAVHSICAGGGKAWVGTDQGTVVEIDVGKGEVTRTTVIGQPGKDSDVEVDLSASGGSLAVSASVATEGGFAASLRVFAVAPESLTEKAAAQIGNLGTHDVSDLTIIGSTETVVIGTSGPCLAWKYSARAK